MRIVGFKTSKLRLALKRPSTPDFRGIGKAIIDHIRASNAAGRGVDGTVHKRYSTKPLNVPTKRGARAFGPPVEKPIIYPKALKPKDTMRHFPGGYRQYKVEVTGSATVNHRLTGRLLNGLFQKVSMPKKGSSDPVKTEITTRIDVDKTVGVKLIAEFGRHWFGIGTKMQEIIGRIRDMWRVVSDKRGRKNV